MTRNQTLTFNCIATLTMIALTIWQLIMQAAQGTTIDLPVTLMWVGLWFYSLWVLVEIIFDVLDYEASERDSWIAAHMPPLFPEEILPV